MTFPKPSSANVTVWLQCVSTQFVATIFFRIRVLNCLRFINGVWIKFCVKRSEYVTETIEMLPTTFGQEALNKTNGFWTRLAFLGRLSFIEYDKRSGRPTNSKTDEHIEKIGKLIRADRRLTRQELADNIGTSYGLCQEILTEGLKPRRISAKFVPRLLTNDP